MSITILASHNHKKQDNRGRKVISPRVAASRQMLHVHSTTQWNSVESQVGSGYVFNGSGYMLFCKFCQYNVAWKGVDTCYMI